MGEKLFIALIGAILALALKEVLDRRKLRASGRRIAALVAEHLEIIKKDLVSHVDVSGGMARFGETQYCEAIVADSLYASVTSNLACFGGIDSIKKTILFFHHYKANMAAIKVRLDGANTNAVTVREGTFRNLLSYLEDAISELKAIAEKRCVFA